MGLFGRRRAPEEPWRPPAPGSCSCEQHVEDLRDLRIPFAAGTSRDGEMPVADLVDAGALPVRLALPDETFAPLPHSGQMTGPYHWMLEPGDEVRLLFDEDAPVHLDDCLAVQPGVERVLLTEVRAFAVGAATLCPSGVQAAMVTALTNPRVRRSG